MKKLVSIVIPVYNKEKYISKCLSSIINQTYKNIEIIVVNDGSTDSSEKIIKTNFHDERIFYYYKKNGGVSSARNFGLNKVTGEKIVFIDADDYIDEKYIEELVKYETDLVICSYNTICNEKCFFEESYSFFSKKNLEICEFCFLPKMRKIICTPYLKLYDSKIIKDNDLKFNEKIKYGEDTSFVMNYLKFTNSLNVIDYRGYYNVIESNDSLSRKFVDNIVAQLDYLDDIIISSNVSNKYKDYWLFRNLKTILYNYRCKSYKELKIVLKNVHSNYYYNNINNLELFSKYDKILYYLFKHECCFIIYILYKLRFR